MALSANVPAVSPFSFAVVNGQEDAWPVSDTRGRVVMGWFSGSRDEVKSITCPFKGLNVPLKSPTDKKGERRDAGASLPVPPPFTVSSCGGHLRGEDTRERPDPVFLREAACRPLPLGAPEAECRQTPRLPRPLRPALGRVAERLPAEVAGQALVPALPPPGSPHSPGGGSGSSQGRQRRRR